MTDTDTIDYNDPPPPRAGFTPPYISFKTLMNTIERMASEGGVPSRIDRSYLMNLPGGTQTMFIGAMKSLGLIDDEHKPTMLLTDLVEDAENRGIMIGDIISEKYKTALELGPLATQAQLEDEFRQYGITGSTLRKAIAFYLAAARFAGLKLSPHFRAPRVQENGRKAPTRKKKQQPAIPPPDPPVTVSDPKARYLDLLLKKVEDDPSDQKLLDRVERLLGFPEHPPESPASGESRGDSH